MLVHRVQTVGSRDSLPLTIPKSGLALELSEMDSGADVDVHLLASLDSGDCIDRGHWLAGSWVTAGTYWVIADSWVNSSGWSYREATLRVGLTTEEDLMAEGVAADVAEDAIVAFDVAWLNGLNSFVYSITDFSLHSAQERFWIYDLAGQDLLYNLHVAHGQASSIPMTPHMPAHFPIFQIVINPAWV